jgi:alpha-glucosidase (family GH31 glycosyl hydrolase)
MSLPPVPEFHPIANPDAVVCSGPVRFTVITDRLIRIEYDRKGNFEDRPSQAFWYRQQPVPAFTQKVTAEGIEIKTDYLYLHYVAHPRGFKRETLWIELKHSGLIWHYGDSQKDNLKGTARTLDGDAGNTRLDKGLLSRAGWVVVDDSTTPVFNANGWMTVRDDNAPRSLFGRGKSKTSDLYFFGYADDYRACLRDFTRVAGAIPMVPRYILGNWWSRYWEYSQEDIKSLMQDFQAHEVPLSICIIDMDWHITKTGNRSDGWTGYTWNRKLFPDPPALILWLHEQGLKTALNLHPANGVYPHEAQYPELAQWMEIDPASKKPIPFDIADPHFAEGYFDILHHPYEESGDYGHPSDKKINEGVDFWWMDYQQKRTSSIPGLDPLWWLNHLHFQDLGRDGRKRPFVFSRWGGLGNHRYPIGFSGDTFVQWRTLAYQPYFTATAANVAYGWWSHDLGGHMFKDLTPELYLRWVQFGVFSPIFRVHSTKRAELERRPWLKPERYFKAARTAMQLRHALIPYIYSMAWRAHQTGISLVTPMYYGHMTEPEAYRAKDQYFFGSELFAAPITSAAPAGSSRAEKQVWFPAGKWTNFFDGANFEGNRWHKITADLEDVPVFARAGAIVPLGPMVGWGGIDNPGTLDLYVFPGEDNCFELYEDDGTTTDYIHGKFAITRFALKGNEFIIHATEGDRNLVPVKRVYRIHVRGVEEDFKFSQPGSYDTKTRTYSLEPFTISPAQEKTIVFEKL